MVTDKCRAPAAWLVFRNFVARGDFGLVNPGVGWFNNGHVTLPSEGFWIDTANGARTALSARTEEPSARGQGCPRSVCRGDRLGLPVGLERKRSRGRYGKSGHGG